jgi:hypothetical protein
VQHHSSADSRPPTRARNPILTRDPRRLRDALAAQRVREIVGG